MKKGIYSIKNGKKELVADKTPLDLIEEIKIKAEDAHNRLDNLPVPLGAGPGLEINRNTNNIQIRIMDSGTFDEIFRPNSPANLKRDERGIQLIFPRVTLEKFRDTTSPDILTEDGLYIIVDDQNNFLGIGQMLDGSRNIVAEKNMYKVFTPNMWNDNNSFANGILEITFNNTILPSRAIFKFFENTDTELIPRKYEVIQNRLRIDFNGATVKPNIQEIHIIG